MADKTGIETYKDGPLMHWPKVTVEELKAALKQDPRDKYRKTGEIKYGPGDNQKIEVTVTEPHPNAFNSIVAGTARISMSFPPITTSGGKAEEQFFKQYEAAKTAAIANWKKTHQPDARLDVKAGDEVKLVAASGSVGFFKVNADKLEAVKYIAEYNVDGVPASAPFGKAFTPAQIQSQKFIFPDGVKVNFDLHDIKGQKIENPPETLKKLPAELQQKYPQTKSAAADQSPEGKALAAIAAGKVPSAPDSKGPTGIDTVGAPGHTGSGLQRATSVGIV